MTGAAAGTRRWRLVLLVAALPVLAAAALLAAALQREPMVVAHEEIQPRDVARALALLRRHDPRHVGAGMARPLTLLERDIELLADHTLQRTLQGATQVELRAGSATLRASLHLPAHALAPLFGRWLNVELALDAGPRWPVVHSASLGRLPLPASWVAPVLRHLADHAGLQAEQQFAAELLQQVRFEPGRLTVVYAWRQDSPQRLLSALLPVAEQQRLQLYGRRLAELTAAQPAAADLALADLLVPLVRLAAQRTAEGADAATENRAALVALTLWANGAAPTPGAARPRARLLLAGRDDYPRHFLVSAALAAEGGGPLSKAIGLYKELVDARGGSGFSFTDLAANRAGTRFGERAVSDPRRLQAAVAAGVRDHDLVPPLADLPEFLPEPEFARRFGAVGAPPYEALLAEIDRRIDALPLLR